MVEAVQPEHSMEELKAQLEIGVNGGILISPLHL